jgi:ribosome-interacting GTPase 1
MSVWHQGEPNGSSIQTSDLILMILDATKRAEQRALLEAELEAVGIRLNREPP